MMQKDKSAASVQSRNKEHPCAVRDRPNATRVAMERMELYCMAHPGSPSSVRRPQLLVRGGVWIALLGASINEGIAGFGSTVETALQAFDAQYLRGLRPPSAKHCVGQRQHHKVENLN